MYRPAASWWCRLAALFLLLGVVLSPLRAVAATVPVLLAYDAAIRSTPTTALGRHDAVRPETERARAACDDATFAYDDSSNGPTPAGVRGVRAYEGALNLTGRREVAEGLIYDAPVATTAAEGASSVPLLTQGTGRAMLGEAMNVIKATAPEGRAALANELLGQIQARAVGGAWSATEMAAANGARAWVGETHTLVIDAAGNVFSGAHAVPGAVQFGMIDGQVGVLGWPGLQQLF